jgi:hypothetical protein
LRQRRMRRININEQGGRVLTTCCWEKLPYQISLPKD